MVSNNDPFEEFEFRPINEGLGFHRKQKAATISPNLTEVTDRPTRKTDQSKGLDRAQTNAKVLETAGLTETTTFQSPLPRPQAPARPQVHVPTIEDDSISKAQSAVNDILKSLNQKKQLDFIEATEKQKQAYKKSKPQLFAAVLDGMLIVSAFLLSLIVMLSITKVDLFMNLSHPETSKMIYVATAALFLAIHFIYMVANRAFSGFTPGEWAFDQVCGREGQMQELTYIPRLVLRTVLTVVTGFVILPFLSFLFNKDVAGEISGVSLFQKPHVKQS